MKRPAADGKRRVHAPSSQPVTAGQGRAANSRRVREVAETRSNTASFVYRYRAGNIVLFAALGRRSHAEGLDVVGVLRTAVPFVAGAAAGWLVASLTLDAVPRALAFGAVVVVCTVVVGMLLRRVIGDGTAVSFVIVATTVLSVLLLGWRLVARLVA